MAQNAKRSSEDRTNRIISVVSALLALAAVVWSLYTYFHPQAPTPAVTFSSYASSTRLFRIKFPSGWAVGETLPSSPTPTPFGNAPDSAAAITPAPVPSYCAPHGIFATGTPVIVNVPCVYAALPTPLIASVASVSTIVDEGVLFMSPDLQSEFAVWTGQYEPQEPDLPLFLTLYISTVNGRDVGPVGFGIRKGNGATWTTLSTLFTRVNAEESGVLYYTRRGDTSYYVLWSAPSTRESSDKSTFFDPMLSSLMLL